MFFKKKKNSELRDKADSVLTTFLLAIPLIALLCGLTIDVSKNIYLKNMYAQHAQAAVETAVKSIDARGSLGDSAINKLKTEFSIQNDSAKANAKAGRNVATNENKVYENDYCSSAENNSLGKNLPYYEITLSGKRGNAPAKYSVSGSGNSFKMNPSDSAKYKVISADVYTASQNMVLGMAGRLFGSDDLNCQVYKSSVSAIAFGSNEDL